jgi:glycosyltransferase involved in cell wall biosynthesis/SAM-dependent methyltransferase
MKISFLIPSKNRLSLLKRCLETIRAQKDQDIEIIIADNASTDDYKSYIDQLSDVRIIYFRQPRPVPVTENWQTALSLATGDYILMLGDDDALVPDFFGTVGPLLSASSPEIVYLPAYHYCYPNVIPEAPQGYFGPIGCEFLPNENGAFCLLPHYARDLATSVLDFQHRYGLNAQHFLIKRSFVNEIADVGPLYQGPYPDFFAAVVTFMRAQSITVVTKPSVIIGISPSSFGAYYFSARQNEGYDFLANRQVDPSVLNALRDTILPGDMNNTNWLIAAEIARRAIASSYPRGINIDRYTVIQINSILRNHYISRLPSETSFAELRTKLSAQALLLFEILQAAVEVVDESDQNLLSRVLAAMERQVAQYSPSHFSIIDIGIHADITDAFDWLAGKRPLEPQTDSSRIGLKENLPDERRELGPQIDSSPIQQKEIEGNRMPKRKITARRLARALVVRLLPPVRRLYERLANDACRIEVLKADITRLEAELTKRFGEEQALPGAAVNVEVAPSSLSILVTRDGKQTMIAPEEFDDFDFKQDDELSIIPPSEASTLLRTPERHFHIPTEEGYGIRVPLKMSFAEFKGYSVPEHLIALTGAGFETLDSIGKAHIANYAKHIGINPNMTFLEIGSGIGRDAFQLIDFLSPKGRYIGIDVQRESILWCQNNIGREHPNFEFHHFNAYHELHNPLASNKTTDFRLPMPDNSVDRIALGSVLTHIFEEEVIHYMREIARVLKSDGLVYATFFLYRPEVVAKSRSESLTPYNLRFEHAYGDGCYVNDATYPTGGVAYTDEAMQRMIGNSGLRLVRPYLKGAWSGYYPAEETEDGQDVAILGK